MRGFTLTELIIAMAIAGILASVAYPTYQEAVRKTRRAEARTALMQLMQQEERFYSQNTRYVAFSSDSIEQEGKAFKWYSGSTPDSSAYELSAAACAGDTLSNCVTITARPRGEKIESAFRDPVCGALALSSTGARSAAGGVDRCWQ